MKRHLEGCWLGLAAGLSTACVGDAHRDDADTAPELEARDGDAVQSACPGSRIVGRRRANATTCPNPDYPGWEVTNVLQAGTEYLAGGRYGCPTCVLSSNKLLATLGTEVEVQEVTELAVEVVDGNGSITRVSLGDVELDHETITEIEIDPALLPADVKYAEVVVSTATAPAPLRNDLLVQ